MRVDRDEHPRRGAAPREVAEDSEADRVRDQRRRSRRISSALYTQGRRCVRGVPRGVRHRQERVDEGGRDPLLPRRHPVLQARRRSKRPATSTSRSARRAPVGQLHKQALLNAMGAFEAARPKDIASRKKQRYRSTRSSARRSTSTRRCSRPTTDRRRDLQERPDVLRLRRVRRGDQTVRRDRDEVSEGSERGSRRRSHPVGAQQGAGLREHRVLGAQAEDRAVVRGARISRSA